MSSNRFARFGARLLASVFVVAMMAGAAGAAGVVVEIVIKDGDPAPDLPVGTVFVSFGIPALNASGDLAFLANIAGPDVTVPVNDFGIWAPDGMGDFRLIARRNDQAPGTPTGTLFGSFFNPHVNGSGEVAFTVFLRGPGVTNNNVRAIFGPDGTGGLDLIARQGDQAPGTTLGTVFGSLQNITFNESGKVAFVTSLTGPDVDFNLNNTGIWGPDGTGGLRLIARTGDQAPGTALGTVFSRLFNESFNGSGEVAFSGFLRGGGCCLGDSGIWGPDGTGSLGLIAREGNQAPGTPLGTVFGDIQGQSVGLNGSGEVTFSSFLRGPGVSSANNKGIWGPDGVGGLDLIVRKGDQAQGTPLGTVFSGLDSPRLNGFGEAVFTAVLSGSGVTSANDRGMWGPDGTGGLRLIARDGDQAPGTPLGTVFSSFFTPAMNLSGEVAFNGFVTGPGVTSANDRGIWGPDGTGDLGLIVREGDVFELSPGNNRPLFVWGFHENTGNQDGRWSGLSDNSQTGLTAIFNPTTSRAILRSDPTAIQFEFSGFQSPIENLPVVNVAKAGQTVPVKWQIRDGNGDFIRDLDAVTGLQIATVQCTDEGNTFENTVDAVATGQTGLRYDEVDEQFIYNWKTQKNMRGSCMLFGLELFETSVNLARFDLTK